MYILNESLKAYSDEFLNARNRKICFRRFTALELGFHQLVLGAALALGEDGNIAKIHRNQGFVADSDGFWMVFVLRKKYLCDLIRTEIMSRSGKPFNAGNFIGTPMV